MADEWKGIERRKPARSGMGVIEELLCEDLKTIKDDVRAIKEQARDNHEAIEILKVRVQNGLSEKMGAISDGFKRLEERINRRLEDGDKQLKELENFRWCITMVNGWRDNLPRFLIKAGGMVFLIMVILQLGNETVKNIIKNWMG